MDCKTKWGWAVLGMANGILAIFHFAVSHPKTGVAYVFLFGLSCFYFRIVNDGR